MHQRAGQKGFHSPGISGTNLYRHYSERHDKYFMSIKMK